MSGQRYEDRRLLDHKNKIDAERKARAIDRRHQETLRNLTPGTATPATINRSAEQEEVTACD